MSRCQWTISWVGQCPEEAAPDSPYCTKHQHNCAACGQTANHDCEATIGPLVCGFPLCPTCRHEGGWEFKHTGPNAPKDVP